MAVDMYKTMVGWSECKKGDEKHSPTHKLLTNEEYRRMSDEINDLLEIVKEKEKEKKIEVGKIQKAAMSYKEEADMKAQATTSEALLRAKIAEEERDRQINLNNNLLRIMRERANAKRGIQPKKEHHGYRFSGKIMQTKTICGHDKKEGAIYTDVWTATLETPYDGTIPINQIRDKIFDDLKGTEGILSKLYIKYWTYKDSPVIWKGTYAEAMNDNAGGENYLFDYKFMINPKSRLWEVQITTTKSIRALAEMMG